MSQLIHVVRLCILLFSVALVFATTVAQAESLQSNGLVLASADPAALSGVVSVLGVADHPAFRKWQLDLLLGDEAVVFLSLGEQPVATLGQLASLDTLLYPDGEHRLRLRVVHSNLNYDEYFLPVRIANRTSLPGSGPASATLAPQPEPIRPAVIASPPAISRASNGLSFVAQGDLVSVRGVADHPAFRKWQVDLLLFGDPDQAAFLSVGDVPVLAATELAVFQKAEFPEGEHQLRLRVVRNDQNYDEYLQPFTIGAGDSLFSSGAGGTRTPLQIRGPAENKAIYLTFDDGPHPQNTPQVLEVLAEYNAKATFFLVGSRVQGQGELLKNIYEAGHAIGNHSWSHRKLGKLDWETFADEIGTTAEILGSYGSSCLRPPYGDVGPQLYANAEQAGYRIIYWSVDPLDWLNQNPETIAKRVLAQARPGAIVLLHDGGDSRAGTVAALRTILATLTEEGYSFPALCR